MCDDSNVVGMRSVLLTRVCWRSVGLFSDAPCKFSLVPAPGIVCIPSRMPWLATCTELLKHFPAKERWRRAVCNLKALSDVPEDTAST